MNKATVDASGELRLCLLILTIAAFFIYFLGARDTSSGSSAYSHMGKNRAYLLLVFILLFLSYVIGRGADAEWAMPITNFLGDLFDRIPKFSN